MVDGSSVSDCPLPCKTTQTEAKLLYEDKGNSTEIDIYFSSKVRITTTDLVKPALSTFLSEVRLEFMKVVGKPKVNFIRLADQWDSGLVLEQFKFFSS